MVIEKIATSDIEKEGVMQKAIEAMKKKKRTNTMISRFQDRRNDGVWQCLPRRCVRFGLMWLTGDDDIVTGKVIKPHD
jgi:hypothetical protein